MTAPTISGATRFGRSYLELYLRCPTKWFNHYIRPHPKGGQGCVPRKTDRPLLVGSGFHEGIDVYYQSGWSDGHYRIEDAIAAATIHMGTRREEFAEIDDYNSDLALVHNLLRSYHDYYGAGGYNPEYPSVKIQVDNTGTPIIEREYEIDLGYRGYVFTSRIDMLVDFNGYVSVMEHKTVAASRLNSLISQFGISLQALGEYFVIHTMHPELPIQGVVLNATVKNRSPRSQEPPFKREVVSFSHQDLEKFRIDVVSTLKEIDASTQAYTHYLQKGMSVGEAARLSFRMHRHECVMFRRCPYYVPCKSLGMEDGMFNATSFRPHTGLAEPDSEEDA